MGFGSKQGRAIADPFRPRAAGICDRCGFAYQHHHLRWQYDYTGANLTNKRILVCQKCEDLPQPQLQIYVITPDPLPIMNARVPDYLDAEIDYRIANVVTTVHPIVGVPEVTGDQRTTQDGNYRVPQQTGEPPYGFNQLPGTNFPVPGDSDPGLPYDNTSVPNTGPLGNVAYTPRKPHVDIYLLLQSGARLLLQN